MSKFFQKIIVFILCVGFLGFSSKVYAQETSPQELKPKEIKPKEIKIVFIAYSNPDQLVDDVKPVVDFLSNELKMKVKHFVATDYAAVVEALRYKSADMGFMGPLQYIMAHDQAGAYPILGEIYNGRPTYLSKIFVRKDSGLKELNQLSGKTIAFVDPISSSGYMYPLDIFIKKGYLKNPDQAERYFKRVYFAGGDQQAIHAVLNKFVDAAGIGEYAYQLLRPEVRDQVVSIAESQKIPSHCIVVRKDFHRGTVEQLQKIFLSLNDGKNRNLLKHLYNVDGYIKVSHEDYQKVEKIARKYGFLKKKALKSKTHALRHRTE